MSVVQSAQLSARARQHRPVDEVLALFLPEGLNW